MSVASKRAIRPKRTRAFFAGTSFVDGQWPAIQFLAVECAHGGRSVGVIIHGDERKAARFAGHAIHHQLHFADLAVLFEKILKIIFCGLEGKISYVQFHCDLLE
jgi:hypothetical protein